MFTLTADIGIDLGTVNVVVYVRGKGIVLREPSVVAIDKETDKISAVGEEARRMLGRTPGTIVAVRPLRDGAIADYDVTEIMLKHFFSKVCGRRMLFRPRVVLCVPSGLTSVERRAVVEAAAESGAGRTWLLDQPIAAALGAGLDIAQPSGNMVIDIGGGTTEVAILSLRGVVVSHSARVGGDKFDAAIVRYMKHTHNLMIGDQTAEELKIRIGAAFPGSREDAVSVRGRDLVSGLPKIVRITSDETCQALADPVEQVLYAIRTALEKTPPELAADIVDKGAVLTGGGSLLHGLDKLISRETSIPVYLAEDPMSCVALGAGKTLESLPGYADIMSGGR